MFEYALSWLVTILLINLVLLYLAWTTYGPHINVHILKKDEKDLIFGKFYYFAQSCSVSNVVYFLLDQLRKEALELKLPKEHTPRI